MLDRRTKLRWRRSVKRRQKQAIELGSATEDNLNRYVFRRLMRLVAVRRFVLGWLGLLVVLTFAVVLQSRSLAGFYLEDRPVAGGTFREGIIGSFTNANPLYAQGEVDTSVSRLVFSGLFTYGPKGDLIPELAEGYTLDTTETLYTVKLKKGITWHDGTPLTSQDVVYTFEVIQNPLAKSYLYSSWKGISVTAVDEHTVNFKLANSLSAFPQSLTVGLVPKHILSGIEPEQLRSTDFNNQRPVGTGIFKFQTIEIEKVGDQAMSRIALVANEDYFNGVPQLDRFVIRTYPDEETIVEAFNKKEVDSIVGLSSIPESIPTDEIVQHNVALTSEVMVFFKNSQAILSDANIRKALVLGIDKQEALKSLGYPVLPVNSPLLGFQVGYNKSLVQVTGNKVEAAKILDAAGWVANPTTKIREKSGQQLRFRLLSSTNSEFTSMAGNLQKQWRDLGVEVEVVLQEDDELQSSVSGHNYDALMYGISVGSDPDVYAYWHGSQGDVRSETRLNLSEYKSAAADKALEAGRTRSDAENRAIKYRPFLDAWRNDNPALALYQPRFLYLTSPSLSGFDFDITHTPGDRYISVKDWTIRSKEQKILDR